MPDAHVLPTSPGPPFPAPFDPPLTTLPAPALVAQVVPLLAGLSGKGVSPVTWASCVAALVGVGLLEQGGAPPGVGDIWSMLSAVAFGLQVCVLQAAQHVCMLALIWSVAGCLVDVAPDYTPHQAHTNSVERRFTLSCHPAYATKLAHLIEFCTLLHCLAGVPHRAPRAHPGQQQQPVPHGSG